MNTAPADFLRKPQAPRVGWLLLGLGLVALGCALLTDERWAIERARAQQDEEESIAALRAAQAPSIAAAPTVGQLRWRQAQIELRRPWLPSLRAVESATAEPVFLLSLSVEPVTGVIKLDGEAPSFDQALAFVQVLDLNDTLNPAQIVSHDTLTDATGRSSVRFTAITRWRAP